MNIISGVAQGTGAVINGVAQVADKVAGDCGATKNLATVFSSAIEASNIYTGVQRAATTCLFMKGVAEVAGAFESVGTLTTIVSGKVFVDNAISIDGEKYPNPLTFLATSCTLVSQAGGTVKFLSALDYLDIGKVATSVGSIPYFGSALEFGFKELPIVRTTFGIVGIIFNICEQFRQISIVGLNWAITLRLMTFGGKLAFLMLIETQVAWIKFLAHVANGVACSASLLGVVAK
jgi:hypothetical protein